MILSKISAANLKGRTFEYPLGKAVLVVGPNFSGKTAIVEAIRLACMGYIPEVGKLAKATFEMASDQVMAVEAHFSDESAITRTFTSGRAAMHTNAGKKPMMVDLESLPLLHAEHYFTLTDTQRTDYVFDRIQLPEVYSSHAIIAEIERLSLGEKHSEAVEEAKRDLVKELHEFFVGDAQVQEAIGKSVETLREKFTYWNRRAKETQGAVATLTELKLREKQVRAVPVNLEQDIESAQAELSRLNTEKGRVTAERDAAERNAGRRKQLQQLLDADRIDYPRMLQQKQEKKQALEKDLVPEPGPLEIEQTRRTIINATGTIRAANHDLEIDDKDIGEADKRLKEIAHLKACPYCKSKGDGWKKTLEAELNERKTNAEQAIKTDTKRRDKAAGELQDANETLETLLRTQESNHRLREQIRQLDREIGNLTIDQKNEGERRERWQTEIKDIPKPADIKRLTQQIATLENERVAAATRLSELNGLKSQETQLKQDLLRATESEQEHQAAAAHLLIIKAVADFLKQKREAIICEAFTKLLQVANMVVKSILKSPLVLHENTIGRFDGAKFVPHRVFSGTEKALAYISIATALSMDAPIKLVLLDEFGRLDANNQMHMINRLLHLVNEKVIDQFIVVGTEIPKQVTVGKGSKVLQVIELGK